MAFDWTINKAAFAFNFGKICYVGAENSNKYITPNDIHFGEHASGTPSNTAFAVKIGDDDTSDFENIYLENTWLPSRTLYGDDLISKYLSHTRIDIQQLDKHSEVAGMSYENWPVTDIVDFDIYVQDVTYTGIVFRGYTTAWNASFGWFNRFTLGSIVIDPMTLGRCYFTIHKDTADNEVIKYFPNNIQWQGWQRTDVTWADLNHHARIDKVAGANNNVHSFIFDCTNFLDMGSVAWRGGGITELILPDEMTRISTNAFSCMVDTDENTGESCYSPNYFTDITLPSSLVRLGMNAFGYNPYLTYVDLNNFDLQYVQDVFDCNMNFINKVYSYNADIFIQGHGILTRFDNWVDTYNNLEYALGYGKGRVPVILVTEYSFYSQTTGYKYFNMYNLCLRPILENQIQYPFKYICYTVSGFYLSWQQNKSGDNQYYSFLFIPLEEVQTNHIGDKAIYVQNDSKYYKLLDNDLQFDPFPANTI
jgi:hypothetical protein